MTTTTFSGYCTLCRSRCGSINDVVDGRLVRVSPAPDHPTGGALCAKGRAAPELVGSPLRLTHPMRRTTPRGAAHPQWEPMTWDAALDEIASRLLAARDQDGAESVAFAVTTPSGTPMVDSIDWVERFIRCFGSPNLLYAVEVCGWHKDYAHALTFGRGIGVPDLDHADVIVLWGFNPARTWLAQASRIAAARQRGAKVVVIDPKQDGSGQQADLWLPVRPGADAALALGAIRHLLETGSYDADFVRDWTNAPLLVDAETGDLLRVKDVDASAIAVRTSVSATSATTSTTISAQPSAAAGTAANAFLMSTASGQWIAFDPARPTPPDVALFAEGEYLSSTGQRRRYRTVLSALRQHVADYTVERVAQLTWIAEDRIAQFNTVFMGAPRLAYHAWTGVGQHTNATQTERAIGTLYALTGACDREGGNLWTRSPPYRLVNEYESLLPASQRAKALGLHDLPLGPPRLGWITARDLAKAVLHAQPYRVRTLVSFGSNLLVTQADAERNARMLRALDFHVHVDVFMNPTADQADIVLPANLPWEREALKLGFEISQQAVEHVQLRPRMVEPPGEARADYDIVMALATRMDMEDAFFGGDIEAGWNHQLAPLGIGVDDLRAQPEGRRFPQPFDTRKYAVMSPDGTVAGFATASRRVELHSSALQDIGQPPLPMFVEPAQHPGSDPAFPVVLTTAKSGWYVHSSHRHIASLRRKSPMPRVQIGAGLADRLGIDDGAWVLVVTRKGATRLKALIARTLHDQVAVAEFGWWQGCEALGLADGAAWGTSSANINAVLDDDERDPVSGSVPLRATLCRIEADPEANRGHWTGMRAFQLVERTQVTDDVQRLELVPVDGKPLPDFLPGQHVIVTLPDMDCRRAYSLVGPNHRPDRLAIAVRLALTPGEAPGRVSSRLHRADLGVTLHLSPPAGVFTIPTETTRPIVLVAGGIGITPFLGYLEALAQRKADGLSTPPVLLVHGARPGSPHPFADTLAALAASIGNVELMFVHGPVLANLERLSTQLVARRPLAYLCGAPGFLTEVRQALCAHGMPDFDIFDETFSSEVTIPRTLAPQRVGIEEANAGPGTGPGVHVSADALAQGSDTLPSTPSVQFYWAPAMGTLLDAADRAGVPLPSGCRVGQCESCIMSVVDGKVAHLAPYDGPPDRCLTCIAVPLTPVTLRRSP